MQKFQDTATGLEWHFDDGVDVAALPNVPKTLSAQIIPRPSAFHEWNAGAWVLNKAAQDAAHNDGILVQIAELEKQQPRALRELLIDPANAFAKNKLADIDAQIAALRAQLV